MDDVTMYLGTAKKVPTHPALAWHITGQEPITFTSINAEYRGFPRQCLRDNIIAVVVKAAQNHLVLKSIGTSQGVYRISAQSVIIIINPLGIPFLQEWELKGNV